MYLDLFDELRLNKRLIKIAGFEVEAGSAPGDITFFQKYTMNRYFDSQFNKHIVTIYPGEFHCGGGEEYISTVLGSCISVALYDRAIQFGGLNHFMLAYDQTSSKENDALAGRFGEYAMELLINTMLKDAVPHGIW